MRLRLFLSLKAVAQGSLRVGALGSERPSPEFSACIGPVTPAWKKLSLMRGPPNEVLATAPRPLCSQGAGGRGPGCWGQRVWVVGGRGPGWWGADGLGAGGRGPGCLGAQRQPPAASIRASGPTAEPLRTRNSIHMANSFTLSSSKGCFVKACLMLKDASGSLSPLSKPISPSLGPWGFAYRPTQTN